MTGKNSNKPSPICEVCTGWMEIVYVDGKRWLKCRICGNMKKDTDTDRTPL